MKGKGGNGGGGRGEEVGGSGMEEWNERDGEKGIYKTDGTV